MTQLQIDKTRPQRYLVEPREFKGSICSSTYTTLDGVERVQYRDGQTLESYLVEHPKRLVITDTELDGKLTAYYDSLKTIPTQITEQQYDEMLNCLPPCRWNATGNSFVQMFHISERLTGNLVQWCFKRAGKHYGFTNDASLTVADLEAITASVL